MNLAVKPHFYFDEGLSRQMAAGLQRFGFNCVAVSRQTRDRELITQMGNSHGRLAVWLPRDLGSKRSHRTDIVNAGISVAWIRDQNGTAAKQCFLVYSFMYRYREMIAGASSPLYFEVRERITNGIPNAVVRQVIL